MLYLLIIERHLVFKGHLNTHTLRRHHCIFTVLRLSDLWPTIHTQL